jgi:glycosyltransferase involved in cell wall biosynthesis
MRILFVAMPFSIHTARWISQLEGSGHEVHLFSSMDFMELHEDVKGIVYHENFFDYRAGVNPNLQSIQLAGLSWITHPGVKNLIGKVLRALGLRWPRDKQLTNLIRKIKPDCIHSFETQHGGYLVNNVKQHFQGEFPFWIHSNWGIDLHYFGRMAGHLALIQKTLDSLDVLIVEGQRDAQLARDLGYKGESYIFPSVGGGFRHPGIGWLPPSQRRMILVKGTQDVVRRGLVAIRALARCKDVLEGYELALYSSNEETRAAAQLFKYETGLEFKIIGHVSQQEMMVLNSRSRVNISVNMSDGVPNAMLEAMSMGCFPIQSWTSMADEWIINGRTGMLVPPEDPEVIEQAIRLSLADDQMVDSAAIVNSEKIRNELDYEEMRSRVLRFYKEVVNRKSEK